MITARHRNQASSHPLPSRRAASISIATNTTLVLFKLAAGVLTGSVAVLTEGLHSSVDLVASVLAYVSVRKAAKPPDAAHRYGHQKVENLTAAIEGLLILGGLALIIHEAVGRLTANVLVRSPQVGIAVIAFSAFANIALGRYLWRSARRTGSAALDGNATHVRTDAVTSTGVLAGLIAAQLTGDRWIDPATALALAGVIVVSGVRLLHRAGAVLIDTGLDEQELETICGVLDDSVAPALVGYHKLRTRRAGARRHVDVHLQFRRDTSLLDAHVAAHGLKSAIGTQLPGTDVLTHLEPEPAPEPAGTDAHTPLDRAAGADLDPARR